MLARTLTTVGRVGRAVTGVVAEFKTFETLDNFYRVFAKNVLGFDIKPVNLDTCS